ncbi:MAG TPA: hypothetical protein PKW61_09915 [Tenuifilaceae bacterium]|nr:hypothetical protein [Tenuifilaceae bacterium]
MKNLNFNQVISILNADEVSRSEYHSVFEYENIRFAIFSESLSSQPKCLILSNQKLVTPDELLFLCAQTFNVDQFLKRRNAFPIPDAPELQFAKSAKSEAISSICLKFRPIASIDPDEEETPPIDLARFFFMNNEPLYGTLYFTPEGKFAVPMLDVPLSKLNDKTVEPQNPENCENFAIFSQDSLEFSNPNAINTAFLNKSFSNQNTAYISFNPFYSFALIGEKLNTAQVDFNIIHVRTINLNPKPSIELSTYLLNVLEYHKYPLVYFIHGFDAFSHGNFLHLCLNFLYIKKGLNTSIARYGETACVSLSIPENPTSSKSPKFNEILNIFTTSQNDFKRLFPDRELFKINIDFFPISNSEGKFININVTFPIITETCSIVSKQILNFIGIDIKDNSPYY